MRTRSTRRSIRLFFVLCALPLFCVFPFLSAVNNPNENVRTYMTMALVQQHTLKLDHIVETFGWTNDMALVPTNPPYRVSVKAPATSFAGVVPYAVFAAVAPHFGMPFPTNATPHSEIVDYLRVTTWVVRLFAIQLPCFLFLIWLEKYLRDFSSDVSLRLAAVAAAGLGTNYLAYANMFASHAPFAIAAFVSFGLAERELRKSRGDARAVSWRAAFWSGWFCGWSVLLEYHALPLAIVLAIYGVVAFRRPTRLLAFAGGGLFHVALMMLFQWKAYGNPLTPGHRMVESGLRVHHQAGLFGATLPDPEHIRAVWFDLGFGFFGTSPFMWLGLLAIPFALLLPKGPPRQRKLLRWATFVWVFGLFVLSAGASGFGNWRGGWTVGPRYLGAAPPFVAFGALVVGERFARKSRMRRSIVRGVWGGLAIASVLTMGLVGILYDTLPEEIDRPLVQFSIPFIRTGFVPHHIGEWFGWTSITPWYFVLAALLLAPILAALVFDAERSVKDRSLRIGAAVVALAVGLAPSFSRSATSEDQVHAALRNLVQVWEPKGRDRISLLRTEAERFGPRRPCMWYRLADLERIVALNAEAANDERRAQAPRGQCPRRIF
ncbi:hypothetical protein AKJ09_02995 [Labilithrix luteola]|uniref:Glycosyltransferase RgtA/B/C/D-like domain-containing protein n=1 Tax=Labilithrix luteola TaxID=1391654 RepID=A0A0K1PSJ2_9BACT|nr:hypothetical protein AKJ09_02995 [Labilithrix luteola]